MAIITVTNLSAGDVPLPAPFSGSLAKGKSREFNLPAYKLDTPNVQKLKKAGLIDISVADDANVANTLETGTIGSAAADSVGTTAIADGAVTTAKLANNVLSADATGRGKMANGFLSADNTGRGKVADGFVNTAKLADGALSADAPGLAKMADGFLSADAAGRAKVADGFVTHAKTKRFVSSTRTGTGAEETVAHGLGGTPAVVKVVPQGGHDGAGAAGTQFPAISYGAHTGTDVLVTVSQGADYYIEAWL